MLPSQQAVKIINQSSRIRFIWDSLILILIFFYLYPDSLSNRFSTYCSRCGVLCLFMGSDLFFIVDIFLNFFTSYRYQGEEITDQKKISKHYLKTQFPIDLLANFPLDLLFLLLPHFQLFSVPLVLVFRLLRLLRISRMYVIFQRWARANLGK